MRRTLWLHFVLAAAAFIPHTQQLTRRRSTRCHAKGKPQKKSRGRGAKFEETRDAETRYAARLTELLTLERKEEEEGEETDPESDDEALFTE